MAPTIGLREVAYDYPGSVSALDQVTVDLTRGCVCVVGQNGSGKSTLMKHLNGLLRPTAGRVDVDGVDTARQSVAKLAATVGLVFQNPDDQLFYSTLRAEVQYGAKNLGIPDRRAGELATTALERFGLADVDDRNPLDFGLSVRKLIAIASVVAMDTPLVVLDEPTAGQDAAGLAALERLCHDLVADDRLVVVGTHDVEFAAKVADRIVVMHAGRVLLDGPALDVLRQEEDLALSHVRPPTALRLANRLGVSVPTRTAEDLVDALCQRRGVTR